MARKALIAGLLLLLVPSLVLAQADLTGRVAGVITDEEGNPVAGARIELISPALQGERIIKTDDNGRYLAALLPVGAYALSVTSPGVAAWRGPTSGNVPRGSLWKPQALTLIP